MEKYKQWLEKQIERCRNDKDLPREHWAFCKAYEKLTELTENGVFRLIPAEPKLYTVIYTTKDGTKKQRETNNENTALNWEVRLNGEIYIDTRFEAKKRLYNYILNKNRL